MGLEQAGPEFGRTLDSSLIETGLRRLNPDIHFDLAARIGQWHPRIATRQGVFHLGHHICSMDRGMVPEFKVWSVEHYMEEVGWYEADKEGAVVTFEVLLPSFPGYQDMYEEAERGSSPNLQLSEDGKLQRRRCMAKRARRGRCVRVGWRHTFEKLLLTGIPGVTRESLGRTFGVDMYAFPIGEPDELVAALVDE